MCHTLRYESVDQCSVAPTSDGREYTVCRQAESLLQYHITVLVPAFLNSVCRAASAGCKLSIWRMIDPLMKPPWFCQSEPSCILGERGSEYDASSSCLDIVWGVLVDGAGYASYYWVGSAN